MWYCITKSSRWWWQHQSYNKEISNKQVMSYEYVILLLKCIVITYSIYYRCISCTSPWYMYLAQNKCTCHHLDISTFCYCCLNSSYLILLLYVAALFWPHFWLYACIATFFPSRFLSFQIGVITSPMGFFFLSSCDIDFAMFTICKPLSLCNDENIYIIYKTNQL